MSIRIVARHADSHKHATRIERARSFVAEGRVIEAEDTYGWRVFSDSGAIYNVTLTGPRALNPYVCECKWAEKNPDSPCSHAYAVDEYRAARYGQNRWITDVGTRRRPIVVVVMEVF